MADEAKIYENDEAVKICMEHLDKFQPCTVTQPNGKFTDMMPEGVKMTVYCRSHSAEGFLINVTTDELYLEALIAKKYILQSELEALVGGQVR